MDLKGTTFAILTDHASATIKKERLSPTSKARRVAIQNKFMERGGMPDRVETLREIDHSKNCIRARLGFAKPIRNGLRKINNLIESRPSKAET